MVTGVLKIPGGLTPIYLRQNPKINNMRGKDCAFLFKKSLHYTEKCVIQGVGNLVMISTNNHNFF